MCSYGGAWLRKCPSTPSGFARGPNRLRSSQVHRHLLFQTGSCFPLPSPLSFFDPFIYRGQEKLMGRWIPSDIMWWISIRRINSGFVCGINPHYTLIHRLQPGQYIIRRNFIMFVCFEKEKARTGSQKSGPYSMRNCCTAAQ